MGFVLAVFWLTHSLIFKEASLQFSSQMELFLNFKCLRQQEVLIKEGFCMPSILIGDSWGSLVWLAIINDLFCSCLCFLLIMAVCLIVFWCIIYICTKFEWNISWRNIQKYQFLSLSLSTTTFVFFFFFPKTNNLLKNPKTSIKTSNKTQSNPKTKSRTKNQQQSYLTNTLNDCALG